MKSCFSMYFHGTEIILPKNDVHFVGDLGYVKVFYDIATEGYSFRDYLVGVVDKNFLEVVSLFPLSQLGKMEIFDGCVLILVDKGITQEMYRMYQIEKIDSKVVSYSLPFLDFVFISDTIAKVQLEVDGYIVEALYDVSKKEIVSNYFHFIDTFVYDDVRREMIADAVYYLPYNENDVNQIITTININGDIIGPYLDFDQQKVYPSDMDIEDIMAAIVQDMKSHGR